MQNSGFSPWGAIQDSTNINEAISFVTTAGHGGFKIGPEYVEKLSAYTKSHASTIKSGYAFFEEDCAWSLPAFELKLWKIPDSQVNKEMTLKTICHWYPEYINESEDFKRAIAEYPKLAELFRDNKTRAEFNKIINQKHNLDLLSEPDHDGVKLAFFVEREYQKDDSVSFKIRFKSKGEKLTRLILNSKALLSVKDEESIQEGIIETLKGLGLQIAANK